MKNIYKLITVSILISFFICCEENEKFSGSPIGTDVVFEKIIATVTSSETNIVAGQKFPITINIPKSFAVDVSIEVTTLLTNTNKLTRRYIIIPANQTTVIGTTTAPGGLGGSQYPFIMDAEVYVSAFNTTSEDSVLYGFEGKQYSIESNRLSLKFGDTPIAEANSNRCGLVFDYYRPNVNLDNLINIVLKRTSNGSTISYSASSTSLIGIFGSPQTNIIPSTGAFSNPSRTRTLNFTNNSIDDEYIIELWAIKLSSSPVDLPYRLTISFPDETSKVIAGTLTGLNLATATTATPKFKVVKTTISGVAKYVVSQI